MICQYREKLNVWEYTQKVASMTQNIGFKAHHDKTQVQSKVKYSVIILGLFQEGRHQQRIELIMRVHACKNCICFTFAAAYIFVGIIFAEMSKPLIKLVKKSHKTEWKLKKRSKTALVQMHTSLDAHYCKLFHVQLATTDLHDAV